MTRFLETLFDAMEIRINGAHVNKDDLIKFSEDMVRGKVRLVSALVKYGDNQTYKMEVETI